MGCAVTVFMGIIYLWANAVADPGFPIAGGGHAPIGGHGPPTWALFGENVCENERIGSHRGWRAQARPT